MGVIMMKNHFLLILIIACLIFQSCSGNAQDAIAPDTNEGDISLSTPYRTFCPGYWQVVIDPDTGQIECFQNREIYLCLNVLGFLEPPALTNLTIDFDTLDISPTNQTISVDVILKHPLPDPTFTGFDVRGVVFGPKVNNADGLTPVMAPEFFEGEPFGYSDGMLGVPNSSADYDGSPWGYKFFCDDLGKDDDIVAFFFDSDNLENRAKFSNGGNLSRHYELDWKNVEQDFFIFNYAVYANYDWPVGEPPIDLDDFAITTANSSEAFCCNITELSNSLYYDEGTGGGSIGLELEIWDWQKNIRDVTIESLDEITIPETTENEATGPGGTEYSYIYEFIDIQGYPQAEGDIDILITVTDPMTFGQCWFLGLLSPSNLLYGEEIYNCFIHTANVSDCPEPTITDVDPDTGWPGSSLDDVVITGEFIDGPDLAVRLELDGEADIQATDVQFENTTTITCDFDLTDAADGNWTLVVVNGCGTPGTYEFFGVGSCEDQNECPTDSMTQFTSIGETSAHQWLGAHCVVTGTSGAEYLLSFQSDSWPPGPPYTFRSGFLALNGDATLHNEVLTPYLPTSQYWRPQWYAVDSNNRCYYTKSSDNYTIYYVDWAESGFGELDQVSGISTTSPWRIIAMTIDDTDNVIVLTYRYISPDYQVRIQRWNDSTWDTTNLPQTIVDANGGYYGWMDIAWNPYTGEYLVTNKAHGVYIPDHTWMGTPTIWAINESGEITWYDDELYTSIADNDQEFRVGVFIEQDDPDCHFVVLVACNELSNVPTDNPFDPKFIRYNPYYGGKTTGTCATDLAHYFWQCLGEVMEYNDSYYWYDGPWAGGLGYIEMPEWE